MKKTEYYKRVFLLVFLILSALTGKTQRPITNGVLNYHVGNDSVSILVTGHVDIDFMVYDGNVVEQCGGIRHTSTNKNGQWCRLDRHITIDYSAENPSYDALHVVPPEGSGKYATITFFLKDPSPLTDDNKTRLFSYLIKHGYVLSEKESLVNVDYSGGPKDVIIPEGTKYIVISKTSGNSPNRDYPIEVFGMEVYQGLDANENTDKKEDTFYDSGFAERQLAIIERNRPISLDRPVDVDGWEIPRTLQQLNALKKMIQYTSIEWTPKKEIRRTDGGVFSPNDKQNIPYHGAPYSSVKEMDKFIGIDVSLETFMTAVNNPYSLLYTECVGTQSGNDPNNIKRSAWGFEYHGINCHEYYGMVCSEFVAAVCGLEIPFGTNAYEWLSKYLKRFVRLECQSPDSLEIGDILWRNGHSMVIAGLHRNNGMVDRVKIAESVSDCAKITTQGRENFIKMLNGTFGSYGKHVLYRPLDLYKNTDYEISPFVKASDDEAEPNYDYNDEICTFAGNKACFRAATAVVDDLHIIKLQDDGDLIVLNYNLNPDDRETFESHHWDRIRLYRDGDGIYGEYLLSEISPNTIPNDQLGHAINLGRNFDYGMYKAYMSDGTMDSDNYTEFEVIDANVAYSFDGDFIDISFYSENATPIAFGIAYQNGGSPSGCKREFTEDEIKNGYVHTNIIRMNHEAREASKKVALIEKYSGQICVKVYFKGKFGRVTNKIVMIDNPWYKP